MLLRVLIADKGDANVRTWNGFSRWKECGCEVAGKVLSIQAVLNAAAKRDFDILLCVNRPDAVTAPDLLQHLSRQYGDIPVIVISQTNDSERMRACFLLGAVDFLTVPFAESDFIGALSRAAERIRSNTAETEYRIALDYMLDTLAPSDADLQKKLRAFLLESQGVTATTESAADYFGFHRDYFSRWFKSKTGTTFSGFYKCFLTEYAQLLLTSGRFQVQDVSRMLGFSSADYFTKVFRKRTGKNPSEMKK